MVTSLSWLLTTRACKLSLQVTDNTFPHESVETMRHNVVHYVYLHGECVLQKCISSCNVIITLIAELIINSKLYIFNLCHFPE